MAEFLRRAISRRVNLILLIVSFAVLGIATVDDIRNREHLRCQAKVNEASAVAQIARSDAASQDRVSDRAESGATAALIQTIFVSKTADQIRAAYARYSTDMAVISQRRAAAEAQRQAHPLPDPPSETCG